MLEILNGREKFYQWDVGQKLIVDESIIAVQYDNGTGDALVCPAYEYEGQYVADVPNIMLQNPWAIKCYAHCGECVRAEKVYEVEKRSRPDDYVYSETEVLRYSSLLEMLTATNDDLTTVEQTLEENIADLAAEHKTDIEAVEKQIAATNDTVNAAIGRIEELEQGGTGGGTASDVDWDENDSSSPAYIKNRTHYREYGVKELLANSSPDAIQEDDGMKIAMYQNRIGLEDGIEYTVIYNGTEYKATAIDAEKLGMGDAMPGVLLGNYGLMMGGESTGEPFVMIDIKAEAVEAMELGFIVYLIDGANTLTLSITGAGYTYHKLDQKYLDMSGYYKKAEIDNTISSLENLVYETIQGAHQIIYPITRTTAGNTSALDFDRISTQVENGYNVALYWKDDYAGIYKILNLTEYKPNEYMLFTAVNGETYWQIRINADNTKINTGKEASSIFRDMATQEYVRVYVDNALSAITDGEGVSY